MCYAVSEYFLFEISERETYNKFDIFFIESYQRITGKFKTPVSLSSCEQTLSVRSTAIQPETS